MTKMQSRRHAGVIRCRSDQSVHVNQCTQAMQADSNAVHRRAFAQAGLWSMGMFNGESFDYAGS
jgi:hypothetical protein